MRGLPGSGKSTKARGLGKGGVVFSTDDFFMDNGVYKYDQTKIGEAHAWNIQRAEGAMSRGVSPVVIDNTNVQVIHAKPYVEIGKKYGYQIRVEEPDSPWWKKLFGESMNENAKTELMDELARRNTHGVPPEVIRKMMDRWDHGPEKFLE